MSKHLSRKGHERDNSPHGLTARLSLAAESGKIFRLEVTGRSASSLVREGETGRRNEVANGQENQTVGPH